MRAGSRRRAAVTALLAIVSVTACTDQPARSASPADLRLERHTWGGLCPDGPCHADLVIEATGRWTFDTESGHREGTITSAEVTRLATAVDQTRLLDATGEATCAADADGTSVRYAWTASGVHHAVSSCDQPLDATDPLVVELENVARAVGR